jgi:hypothetical protein
MFPWSAPEGDGGTLCVRLGTGGEEGGPVLQQGQGTVVFVVGYYQEEAFAVGADIVIDQAEAIDARRRSKGEERNPMADFEALPFFADLDGIHGVVHVDVIELHAIAAPTGPVSSIGGNLPHAVAAGKRNDKNLGPGREKNRHGDESAVGRELSAGIRTGAGRRRNDGPGRLARQDGNGGDFVRSGSVVLGEKEAAVGRPVGDRIVIGFLLKGDRGAGTGSGASDDVKGAVGQTEDGGEAGIVGRPSGFTVDGVVEGETGFVSAGRIEPPDIVSRVAIGDEETLAVSGEARAVVNAFVADVAEVRAGTINPLEARESHGRAGLVDEIVGGGRSGDGQVPDTQVDDNVVEERAGEPLREKELRSSGCAKRPDSLA